MPCKFRVNYAHAFHAGNFADVFKHAVLARIILYLRRKAAPFRVIDTHAGSGRYDLQAEEAGRTEEWRAGIGRLDPASMNAEARNLIEPYYTLADPAKHSATFPGSPAIALALARSFDRMIFCETHPRALSALRDHVGRDKRAKVIALDGYTGLNAFIPPVERRGLVLIDPPFEAAGEFERLTAAILAAHRKWREGIILAWHPIKDRRVVERMAARLANEVEDLLRLELHVDKPSANRRLVGNGLIVINAPFTLQAEMNCLLPDLAKQLGMGAGSFHIEHVSKRPDGTTL